MKEALRDGLRAVKNTIDDGCVLPGAGAFEIAAWKHLRDYASKSVTGKAKIGVEAYADAMLVVPKTLAQNCGFDPQDTIIKLQEEHSKVRFSNPRASMCLVIGLLDGA